MVDALAQLPVQVIYQFTERMAERLYQLDDPDFAEALEAAELGYSADTFLYARCYTVAKGRAFYERVLTKKIPLATAYLESLLYVDNYAYEQKTGKRYQYVPSTIVVLHDP